MSEQQTTSAGLLHELETLRQRVAELEDAERECDHLRAELDRLILQRHAMEAVQRERARAQQYLDIVGVLIVVLDVEGHILLLNRKGYELLEYPEGELLGENWLQTCLPESERERAGDVLQALRVGQCAPDNYCEHPVQTRTGKLRLIAWHQTVVTDDRGQCIGTLSSGMDLTEQRQAEAKLHVEERFSQAMIAALQEGFTVLDVRGVQIQANDAFCRMTGFAREELLGVGPPHPYWPPEALSEIERAFQQTLAGQCEQFELTFQRKNGERFPVLVSPSHVTDRAGHVISYFATVKDITSRKRAERALQQAHDELDVRVRERSAELVQTNARLRQEVEERRRAEEQLAIFHKFAEASGLSIAMADLDLNLTYVNPTLCRLLGEVSPERVLGRCAADYTPPDDRPFVLQTLVPALLRDGQWVGELVVRPRSGPDVPIFLGAFLIRDAQAQPHRLAAIMMDIRERKVAERLLAEQHAELRAIYDGIVDAILIADAGTQEFVRVNAAACQMLGYREEELLGRTVLDITPPEWIPVAARQFATFAQMSGQGRTHDVALQRRDGGVFFADITSNPIVYRGQRCLLGIIRDITERKQALEAVQREQAILQKLLAAEDRERQLVSYEIHDGLVQFLMAARLHFEAYDQRLRERREDARDAYASGRALLQESLTEGRRLVGTLRTPAPDPRGVVAMLEAYLSDQQQYDGLQCEFHTLGSFTGLDAAIENALVRIVQEGVTNVRRHSRSEKVRVEVTAIDGRVRLEIRDWGVGFQPEQLSAGGFGLEGIRARARLLGGTVQIESTPGQGTQILVELPFCPA